MKRTEFLSYYATQFNAVELNFSYYAMPQKKHLENMVRQTESRIQFSIKGNQAFTHAVEIGQWRNAVKDFRFAIEPLQTNNVLSALLLQFPESFHYETERRYYLAELITELETLPLVVEFRHKSWQNERVYNGLTVRGVSMCVCDMPDIKNLPVFKSLVTGCITYMRFHGHNGGSWYNTNARDRYDYIYTDNELAAYKPHLLSMSAKTKTTQIFFNNHAKGSAALNAKKMMALLAE
jgi:uncharacterized protein YecE (DUF72 family)